MYINKRIYLYLKSMIILAKNKMKLKQRLLKAMYMGEVQNEKTIRNISFDNINF